MFKRIMVAIDADKIANSALNKAIALAKEHKALLCIVHALDYSLLVAGGEGINIDALRESAKKSGNAILKKAADKAKKNRVKTIIKLIESSELKSDIADIIIEAAERWRAGLLVISTHGHGGISRFMLGSVADSIIRNTYIPLLLIRSKS